MTDTPDTYAHESLAIDVGLVPAAPGNNQITENVERRAFFEGVAAQMNDAHVVHGDALVGMTLPVTVLYEFVASDTGVYAKGVQVQTNTSEYFFASEETTRKLSETIARLALVHGMMARVVLSSDGMFVSSCQQTIVTGRIDSFDTMYVEEI